MHKKLWILLNCFFNIIDIQQLMYPLTAILLNVSCAKLPRQIHNSARPWKKLPSCSFALLRQKNQDHLLTLSGSIFGQLQKKFNIYTLRDDCTTPRLYSMIEHIVCPLDALSTKKLRNSSFWKSCHGSPKRKSWKEKSRD